jgi:NADH-quinone oxidoreductase subunit M
MILFFLFTTVLFGILFISFSTRRSSIQLVGLTSSGVTLILSSALLVYFDTDLHGFQHVFSFTVNFLNINYIFGLDGISVNFVFLTTLLIFLCLLFGYDERYLKEYFLSLLIIEFFLVFFFSVLFV